MVDSGNEIANSVWQVLNEVQDPEIPVISVVDLGIVRSVDLDKEQIVVTITPTYSGCPATKVIEESIIEALEKAEIKPFEVKTVLNPAWSTEMITEKGRKQLKEYGIAPPAENSIDKAALMGEERQIQCPNCGSHHTHMVSQFGSTPCKAHFKCKDCLEPFDYFKCL